MKITKYLFGLALLALGMSMTSCDQENEGALYNSTNNNISWEKSAVTTTTAENEIVVPVMITRNNKSGELTVSYTAEASNADVMSDDCNGKVTFKDGEGTAFVNVKASNLEKGQTYTYTMSLEDAVVDADTVLKNAIKTINVVVVSDYTWVSAGTCTFIDGNFYDDGENTVEDVAVIQALENPVMFRIVKPYQSLAAFLESAEDVKYFADSDDIEFYLDENGEPDYIKGGGIMGEYTLEYFTDMYLSYCYFFREGNVYTVGHLLGVDGVPTYVGGFSFIWDGPAQ